VNQDQIKKLLLSVRKSEKDFSVILTGKASRKVNGLYKPETCEILLHNRNFQTDEDMLRTALHEYAHHLHAFSPNPPRPGRPHDNAFWSLFHDLLTEAEKRGVYSDVFRKDPEFLRLAREIREGYLEPHGDLMMAFGAKLIEAEELCRKRSLSFRDFVERELGMRMPTVRLGMGTVRHGWDPTLGPDRLKLLNKLNLETAESAQKLFSGGATEAQVANLVMQNARKTELEKVGSTAVMILEKKKKRLQEMIERYQMEIKEIEHLMVQALRGEKDV